MMLLPNNETKELPDDRIKATRSWCQGTYIQSSLKKKGKSVIQITPVHTLRLYLFVTLHFNQRAQLGWPEGFSVVLGMQTEQVEVDELYCPFGLYLRKINS